MSKLVQQRLMLCSSNFCDSVANFMDKKFMKTKFLSLQKFSMILNYVPIPLHRSINRALWNVGL